MSTLIPEKHSGSYHHGDLRRAMIAIGVDLLAEEGADALSLRKVARRAGVSHNAPYQHFADKEALLAAIAEEGFHILGEAISASRTAASPADPKAAVVAAGQAYVRFALTHPDHFQLMFSPLRHTDYPGLARAARTALDQLVALVSVEGMNADPIPYALATWAALHGLSGMLIAQKIPPALLAGRTPEELVAAQMDVLWDGLKTLS